jgi:N-acetylglucosamine kinase-like BadF-type ATPase
MAFYEQNDPVCAAIVEKTCDRIADLVAQVRVGADCGSTVVVAGGLTARADLLLPLLRKRLGDVDVVIPKMPPLFGAALRCARIFGAEIDESAFERSFAEII